MVCIFEKTETKFDTLGMGTLCPNSCQITEELNGIFELELEHPYDVMGKWKRIDIDTIVLADTPTGKQPFRIYRIKPNMDTISVYGRHIFYDLLDNLCQQFQSDVVTADVALQQMQASFAYTMPFVFDTNIVASGALGAKNENPVMVLLSTDDDAQSFIKNFGGELKRDFFHVSLLQSLGRDNGVMIAYRKNLVGLEVTEDISDVGTRIYPFGKDGLALAGTGYIDSPHIAKYPYPKIRILEDSGAETQTELQKMVETYFANGGDLPKTNIQVDFQELSQTVEYRHFTQLERLHLGDIVTIYNQKMKFAQKAKVISYIWDCLKKRYKKIELGDFLPTITTAVTKGTNSNSIAIGASTETKQILSLISGIATIQIDGLYICLDGFTVATSQKMLRLGQNGLQYTNDAGNVWETIIDNNGQIVR